MARNLAIERFVGFFEVIAPTMIGLFAIFMFMMFVGDWYETYKQDYAHDKRRNGRLNRLRDKMRSENIRKEFGDKFVALMEFEEQAYMDKKLYAVEQKEVETFVDANLELIVQYLARPRHRQFISESVETVDDKGEKSLREVSRLVEYDGIMKLFPQTEKSAGAQ